MSPKHEPILKRFNRTDNRVQVLNAVLWSNLHDNKPIGQIHRLILQRRNLIDSDGKLTHLGQCFTERYKKRFREMKPDSHIVTDETKAKMRAARERRKAQPYE